MKPQAETSAQPAGSSSLEDIQTRLQTINKTLEPTIDLFADGIHKISQYRIAAERVADQIIGTGARKLEIRDKDARVATGTSGVDGKEVLGALGRAVGARGER